MAETSVQDKHLPEAVAVLWRNRYAQWLENAWWLDAMPTYAPDNFKRRHEFAQKMSGRDGDGDPVWAGATMHLTEQIPGSPWSVEGPERAVEATVALMHSAPGGYRMFLKQIVNAWITSDLGPCVEIIYTSPRRIRDGVATRPLPIGLDIFDPQRIRLIATEKEAYPFAYTTQRTITSRPGGVDLTGILKGNEIPMHQNSVRRVVNMPQTDEALFGWGVSPTALYCKEWTIAMGQLALLLQDSINTSAYTLLTARGLTAEQVDQAMSDRARRLADGTNNPLASALMLFGENDFMSEANAPMVTGLPLRRYPEQWNWGKWLEERIQLACTILGISPLAVMQSLYSRTTQAGTQAASDESGVRRSSMLVGLGDIWDWLAGQLGASFSYRSHRIADRDREFGVLRTAVEAWKFLYEATNNGIPLLADTAQEAAARARTMMVEQKIIRADYAEGEQVVRWDTGEGAGSGTAAPSAGRGSGTSSAKMLAYLAAAANHDRYVRVEVDPTETGTRASTTVLGTCKLRDPSRPVLWRGMSAEQIQHIARLRELRDALLPGVALKEGGGRAPANAPRAMRKAQEDWEGEIDRLLAELNANLQAPWKEANKEKLLQLIDRWQTNARDAAIVAPDKMATAERLIEEAYQAVEANDDKKMAVLLALLLFADALQRRGEAAIVEAMRALSIKESPVVAEVMAQILTRHGSYVTGSLTPDMVDFWQRSERLSAGLGRRVKVWYGGALWSAMNQLMLAAADYGVMVRVDGPMDENNCMTSDPGSGVACEEIVGRTYRVGVDEIPNLGIDTKCGQACRHFYTVLPA